MYIPAVMTAKRAKRRPTNSLNYNEAFKAEALRLVIESRSTQAAARQLGISPKLLYRRQQAQLVAEVGSEEVARDPEVRALRARHGAQQSRSRRGNGYDKAPAELI